MESFHVKINEAKWKSVHKRDKKQQQQQQQNQTKTGRLFWRRWGMQITTATETAVVDLIPCSAIGLDGKQMVFLSTFNVAICISAFRKVSSLHPPSKSALLVQILVLVFYTNPFISPLLCFTKTPRLALISNWRRGSWLSLSVECLFLRWLWLVWTYFLHLHLSYDTGRWWL